ncbi:MAG: superoxide dismutase [Cu-Zn] SodC [Thiogranum sp.]|nr:superoxide dismutase [Cu-Zn] SodC [Thiogranum sp.]
MNFKMASIVSGALLIGSAMTGIHAADLKVELNKVSKEGAGESIGSVTFRDSSELGLLIIPDLKGLSPGAHGFHVHENPDCGPGTKNGKTVPAGAAGGHYAPENTGKHAGPAGEGHLGDMPALLVGPDGTANMAMFAPRLQVPDLVGRSVVVHEGGDNYSDKPKPLGGGGERVACGVIAVDAI